MTNKDSKEIQVKPKKELASPAEQTQAGAVFTPNVDIFETDQEITLLADLPGVTADNLTIDLRENMLTLVGDVAPLKKDSEENVLIEYETGKFYRQFTLSNVIDQNKIDAILADGVLRLVLPKVKAATPRKIKVQSG
ncbi:MAG: Hsp20/alpha crystallin family protein [Desulfobacterales bacterium]